MIRGRRGAVKVLERISDGSTPPEIRSTVKARGFPYLDAFGPEHVRRAAEHWRLCRLGLVSEILPVVKELAALPDLELVLSLGHDLAANPPDHAWAPGHPLRVATIARLLATEGIEHAIRWKELRWSARPTESGLDGITVGALFHDVGKLLIPPEILHAPGLLTAEQEARLQEHVRLGHLALCQVTWPWTEVLTVTLHHHEKWDGSGYPEGLAGADIPWEAQIVAIADFCDALLTPRPYRPALESEQVAATLRSQAGLAFNPVLVRALSAIWGRVEEELAALSFDLP